MAPVGSELMSPVTITRCWPRSGPAGAEELLRLAQPVIVGERLEVRVEEAEALALASDRSAPTQPRVESSVPIAVGTASTAL